MRTAKDPFLCYATCQAIRCVLVVACGLLLIRVLTQ